MLCYIIISSKILNCAVHLIKFCLPQTQSAWLAKGIITLHFLAKIKKHEIVKGDKGCHLLEKLS